MIEGRCPACDGTGFVVRRREGVDWATHCECSRSASAPRRLEAARIPSRYAHCSLEAFVPQRTLLQENAKRAAVQFVEEFPHASLSTGLLFIGRPGVGKTHLAVAILRSLILERGAEGLFCDHGSLLRTIQATWDRESEVRESDILDEVSEVEILLLDDLGSMRPSPWVQEVLFHILNSRYNSKRVTLLTTNYLDPQAPAATAETRQGDSRETLLEHQIGVRLRSRLHEMCRTVAMDGEDFRKTYKSASFSSP